MIGLLYDRTKINISTQLWVGFFAILLSIVKTIWGALLMPFGMPKYVSILLISIGFKFIALFLLWVTLSKHDEIPEQRVRLLYNVNNNHK